MILPLETQEQVRKNRLYLDNKHRVSESELNKFYEYVLKHGTLLKITVTGMLLIVTDKR